MEKGIEQRRNPCKCQIHPSEASNWYERSIRKTAGNLCTRGHRPSAPLRWRDNHSNHVQEAPCHAKVQIPCQTENYCQQKIIHCYMHLLGGSPSISELTT